MGCGLRRQLAGMWRLCASRFRASQMGATRRRRRVIASFPSLKDTLSKIGSSATMSCTAPAAAGVTHRSQNDRGSMQFIGPVARRTNFTGARRRPIEQMGSDAFCGWWTDGRICTSPRCVSRISRDGGSLSRAGASQGERVAMVLLQTRWTGFGNTRFAHQRAWPPGLPAPVEESARSCSTE